jgi:hypothetical protein
VVAQEQLLLVALAVLVVLELLTLSLEPLLCTLQVEEGDSTVAQEGLEVRAV